jgi:hypothetical protein
MNDGNLTSSSWIVLSRERATLEALAKARPDAPWQALTLPARRGWSDDHASILPHLRWSMLLRTP